MSSVSCTESPVALLSGITTPTPEQTAPVVSSDINGFIPFLHSLLPKSLVLEPLSSSPDTCVQVLHPQNGKNRDYQEIYYYNHAMDAHL